MMTPAEAKRKETEALIREFNELKDYALVMETESGRNVMWGILEFCKTFNSVMTGNSMTYYRAGQQDIGHMLMDKLIQACPELYTTMVAEHTIENVKSRIEVLREQIEGGNSNA